MKKFTHNVITLAMLTSGMAVATQTMAQESQTNDNEPNSSDENFAEVIEVRGIRQSILSSIDKKRFNDTISEIVDAGDLNSLPDISIADSLGRLPGVTTIRASGQSSQLNIRGMDGDFIQTTLNGREQASTSGFSAGSRWISFDQYPAELINQAAVFKSSKASLVEGGVAGTVELKTANPLDADEDHNFTGSARYSYNDEAGDIGADESGYRFSFSYQGKFANDTLGVAIGAAIMRQPNYFKGYDAQSPSNAQDYRGDGSNVRSVDGFQLRQSRGNDERVGMLMSIAYQPNDNFSIIADYFRSEYESEDYRHGLIFDGLEKNLSLYNVDNAAFENISDNGSGANNNDWIVGGTVNNIVYNGPWFEIRTEDQSTDATTDSFGVKFDYQNDDFNVQLDLAHSEGEKSRVDRIAGMHAYRFGDIDINGNVFAGWEELAGQEIAFQFNENAHPSFAVNTDYTDLAHMRLGIFEQFPHVYTDEIDSVKLDFTYHVESDFITSIEVGARYSNRLFEDDRGVFRWGTREGMRGHINADGAVVSDPNTTCEFNSYGYNCAPADVTGFTTQRSVSGIDILEINNLGALATSLFGDDGFNAQKTWNHNWTLIESGGLEEKISAGYVMANFSSELGDIGLTGNVGVRVVRTDTKSIGIQQLQGGLIGDDITDDNGVTRNDYINIKYGPEYTDTLPSINLNFRISENDQVRFAAAKVIGRPPVFQLRGGAGSWADTANDGVSQRYNVWSKGNPNLDPFRANQYDLSYEHFTDDGGAFVLAAFYKDIESLIENITYNEGDIDWSEIGLEAPEGFVEGQYQTVRNTEDGGYIRGIEVAYTTIFSDLGGIFSGLGVNANYSYTESEVTLNGGGSFANAAVGLPGLSENVWSLTVFWDYKGFSTHLNARYRDEYIYNGATPGGATFESADEYLVVDWQASYEFENGVSGVLQVKNLTNEENSSTYGSALSTGRYHSFGRQFYAGANFRF